MRRTKLFRVFSTVNLTFKNTKQERMKCRLEIGLHKKKPSEMFAASKGWILYKKIYQNIILPSYIFWQFLRNCISFLIQSKLTALKYAGQQLIY